MKCIICNKNASAKIATEYNGAVYVCKEHYLDYSKNNLSCKLWLEETIKQ